MAICKECSPLNCKDMNCNIARDLQSTASSCNGTCVFREEKSINSKYCHAPACELGNKIARLQVVFKRENS